MTNHHNQITTRKAGQRSASETGTEKTLTPEQIAAGITSIVEGASWFPGRRNTEINNGQDT